MRSKSLYRIVRPSSTSKWDFVVVDGRQRTAAPEGKTIELIAPPLSTILALSPFVILCLPVEFNGKFLFCRVPRVSARAFKAAGANIEFNIVDMIAVIFALIVIGPVFPILIGFP